MYVSGYLRTFSCSRNYIHIDNMHPSQALVLGQTCAYCVQFYCSRIAQTSQRFTCDMLEFSSLTALRIEY